MKCSTGKADKEADRVIRGGSWNNHARNVRAAYRNWNHPEDRNDNLGFRCRAHTGFAEPLSEQDFSGPRRPHGPWRTKNGRRRAGSARQQPREGSPADRPESSPVA